MRYYIAKDKLFINISRNDTTWKTFGKIQQNIKRNLREEKRPDLVPTFPEFAIYLVRFIITDQPGLNMNNSGQCIVP